MTHERACPNEDRMRAWRFNWLGWRERRNQRDRQRTWGQQIISSRMLSIYLSLGQLSATMESSLWFERVRWRKFSSRLAWLQSQRLWRSLTKILWTVCREKATITVCSRLSHNYTIFKCVTSINSFYASPYTSAGNTERRRSWDGRNITFQG